MYRHLLFVIAGTGLLLGPADLVAQTRLHVVPHVGIGTELQRSTYLEGIYGSRSIDAWTFGAQVELASRRRFTPTAAVQRWSVREEICRNPRQCNESGWGAEAGVSYSFLPISIVRPYGGAAVGIRQLGESDRYVQGRAGLDFTPRLSPLTFRIEGRYHDFVGSGGSMLLLNTGIRFALPIRSP